MLIAYLLRRLGRGAVLLFAVLGFDVPIDRLGLVEDRLDVEARLDDARLVISSPISNSSTVVSIFDSPPLDMINYSKVGESLSAPAFKPTTVSNLILP